MTTEPSASDAGRGGRFDDLDVLVQGEGVRRGVAVEVVGDGIRVDGLRLRREEIFWTSRRAGLLMLFARGKTLAVKGERPALEALARRVEALRGSSGGRGRLPEAVTGEVVVCTAGTAVVGRVAGRDVSGLRVGIFTRRGAHLVAHDGDLQMGWPVEEARAVGDEDDARGGRALLLRKGEDAVRLLYLFPEEIDAILRVARSEPDGEPLADGLRPVEIPELRAPPDADEGPPDDGEPGADGPADDEAAGGGAHPPDGEPVSDGGSEDGDEPASGDGTASDVGSDDPGAVGPGDPAREAGPPGGGPRGEGEGGEIEMFARREVAGPVQPRLPEFRSSVEVLQEASEEAAARLPRRQVEEAGLAPHFLETHFLELGETALGPLLLRKSAAATAPTLARALEAMDASDLQEDTAAAASNAADRTIEVYTRELDRLVAAKRAPTAVEEEHELDVEEREDVRLRVHAPFEKLAPLLHDLEESQDELRRKVRALESGPPEADDQRVRDAAEAWRRALRRVDRGFVDAWDEVVEEIAAVWERRMLPSLAEVGARRRRRMPEWMLLALLAVAALLAAAGVVIFLLR